MRRTSSNTLWSSRKGLQYSQNDINCHVPTSRRTSESLVELIIKPVRISSDKDRGQKINSSLPHLQTRITTIQKCTYHVEVIKLYEMVLDGAFDKKYEKGLLT